MAIVVAARTCTSVVVVSVWLFLHNGNTKSKRNLANGRAKTRQTEQSEQSERSERGEFSEQTEPHT